jgi:hypothetical protein
MDETATLNLSCLASWATKTLVVALSDRRPGDCWFKENGEGESNTDKKSGKATEEAKSYTKLLRL